ncbi:MAG: GDSL-type esterase/lipase family protein, partial [Bacteroidales bacterium]|nr:GDSL-type esterase/lipase family protein [Bacteroidales bacterium]
LASVLPSKCMYWAPEKTNIADKVASLNARIKAYAQQQGITYIDYYSSMVYGTERELNPAYTKDGVHPTPDGYRLGMEPVLQSALHLK